MKVELTHITASLVLGVTLELAGYEIESKIGEGGMASVYRGCQLSLNRPVAIKVLNKNLLSDPGIRSRFERESMIIAQLNHPHIIHVIDRGIQDDQTPYFVMELINGVELTDLIKNKSLNWLKKVDISVQICKALAYAHKNDVIHRDIKPDNVIIDQEGNARVLDFGIAQFYKGNEADHKKTQVGTIMGTMHYMSPEQMASADAATQLSDIYSFGILMYELFTGNIPSGVFPAPSQLDESLPAALDIVIFNCMEMEPEKRPHSIGQVRDALLKLLKGAHIQVEKKQHVEKDLSVIQKNFALLDVIAEDDVSSVYLYEKRDSKQLLVIKRYPCDTGGFEEGKLLSRIKHNNIVHIFGVSKNKRIFIVVMEYLRGGNLHDRLIRVFGMEEFLKIAQQLSAAMSFAHKNRVYHGNLRPSNILFTEKNQIKISDFGLVQHYKHASEGNWYGLENEENPIRQDIYSAGVIFYQMLIGEIPIVQDNAFLKHENFKKMPNYIKQSLERMLQVNSRNAFKDFDDIAKAFDKAKYHIEKARSNYRAIKRFRSKLQRFKVAAVVAAVLVLVVEGLIFYQYF